jgi:putative hemolysin
LDEPPSYNFANIFFQQGLLYFILVAALLLVTAFASAAEAAFFSLTSDDLDGFRNSRNKLDKIAAELLINPRILSSVLTTWKYFTISAAAALTLLSLMSSKVAMPFHVDSVITSLFLLVVSFSIFGVIVPKIYGSTYVISTVRNSSRFCSSLMLVSRRIVNPLLKMSYRVEHRLEEITEQNSVEELTQALELAATDTETTENDKEFLRGIVNFGTLTVKQVMRSRMDISFADVSMNFTQLLDYVQKSGYSRIPVCQSTLDKVEGVLYIKDLLPFLSEPSTFEWKKLLRPGYFIPESKKIDFLLKDFQEKRVHIALVVDEFGGTSGLITLEDVIEEIIGDIHDEFDEVGLSYQKLNATTYLFDGKIALNQFYRAVKIDTTVFDQLKGDNDSLGGLLLEVHGELPKIGEQIVIEPLTFTIEAVDHKRIRKVKVHIHEQKESQR